MRSILRSPRFAAKVVQFRSLSITKRSLFPQTIKNQDALKHESFASGTSASYLEQLEASWLQDKSSVDATWANYFQLLYSGVGVTQSPSLTQTELQHHPKQLTKETLSAAVVALVRAYQVCFLFYLLTHC